MTEREWALRFMDTHWFSLTRSCRLLVSLPFFGLTHTVLLLHLASPNIMIALEDCFGSVTHVGHVTGHRSLQAACTGPASSPEELAGAAAHAAGKERPVTFHMTHMRNEAQFSSATHGEDE